MTNAESGGLAAALKLASENPGPYVPGPSLMPDPRSPMDDILGLLAESRARDTDFWDQNRVFDLR